ncbi:ABC transporter permease [Ruixingdingia sedimenti]|uniref:ABC transporter permease n=1 Tax=Ruixingdingia sedimenti TaxID=3073604 RepID=A0ABU1F8V2_9RHOB|nr:ABC transporter permease [Xinfangfangia sp. LG-4]MDR5653306.1 ABC transporter permease [Xinfangfangia sp. LG-4]
MAKSSSGRIIDQQKIIFALAVVLCLVFAFTLPGFATASNALSLLQAVATIGVLGIGMAIVIIGRGIDLSQIAVLVMPPAWMMYQIQAGVPMAEAAAYAGLAAIALGVLNGWLVAYVEVPAIFATLATGTLMYGTMQYLAVSNDVIPLPKRLEGFIALVQGGTFGIPNIVLFLLLVALVCWLFLRFTVWGRYVYAIGDNPMAARATGVPSRPILVLQYVISALAAFAAGVVLSASVESVNTRLFNSTMIYDVILVVVLGGVGLGGGKGSVSNVLVGTILIGIMTNGMTILNLSIEVQSLIKAGILLAAIIADSMLNPRDELTSQQGDI